MLAIFTRYSNLKLCFCLAKHICLIDVWYYHTSTHPAYAVAQDLKSGILLCELVNKLSPGVVKKVKNFLLLSIYFSNSASVLLYKFYRNLTRHSDSLRPGQSINNAFCPAREHSCFLWSSQGSGCEGHKQFYGWWFVWGIWLAQHVNS